MNLEPLTIKQTATGYWIVQSGGTELSGAVTRAAAEAERDLLKRLRARTSDPPDDAYAKPAS